MENIFLQLLRVKSELKATQKRASRLVTYLQKKEARRGPRLKINMLHLLFVELWERIALNYSSLWALLLMNSKDRGAEAHQHQRAAGPLQSCDSGDCSARPPKHGSAFESCHSLSPPRSAAGHASEPPAASTLAFRDALPSWERSVLKDAEALTHTSLTTGRQTRGISTDHTHELCVDTRLHS